MTITRTQFAPFKVKLAGVEGIVTVLIKPSGNDKTDKLNAFNHALAAHRGRVGNPSVSPLAESIRRSNG